MTVKQNSKIDYLPWILTAAALIIRMLYLSHIAANNPFFRDETLVSQVHHRWAEDIISGTADAQPEVFLRAPLYPFIVAGIYWIAGVDYLYPRLIQLLIGSFLTLAVFYAGRKMFGRKGAVASAIIWIFYFPMIFFEGELFETSMNAVLVFGAYLLLSALDDKKLILKYGLAGLLIGLAVIMKPNSFLFIPAVLIWLCFNKEIVSSKWKAASFLVVGALIAIFPITIRNYTVGKEFTLVAANGGLNIFIGNNEKSDGVSAVIPGQEETDADLQWGLDHHETALTAMSIRLARDETGKDLTPGQASDYWYGQAKEFAINRPLEFVKLNLKKLLLFFSSFEFGNTRDLYFSRQHSWLMSVFLWNGGIKFPLGIIFPFAGLGLFYAIRNKLADNGLLSAFIIGALLSTVIVFVCARFRMNVIPFYIILAGGGITLAFAELNGKKVLTNLAILIPLLFIANFNFFNLEKDVSFQEYFNIGRRYMEKGEYQKGYDNYLKSLSANPEFTPVLNELGIIFEFQGDYKKAALMYGKVLAQKPYDPVALYNLGAAEGKAGFIDSSIVHLKSAVAFDPDFWQAWLNLGNCYLYQMDEDSAGICYIKTLELQPGNPDVLFNMGSYYMIKAENRKALEYFNKVKEIDPNYPTLDKLIEKLSLKNK